MSDPPTLEIPDTGGYVISDCRRLPASSPAQPFAVPNSPPWLGAADPQTAVPFVLAAVCRDSRTVPFP
jgi:hypothetical protein